MKTLKGMAVLMAIMAFITVQGFSQSAPVEAQQKNTQAKACAAPGKFVDNNKDGVCDNHQAKMTTGKCANFVDKDGDGICDNRKASCQGKGNSKCCGTGCQGHQGQGKGNCAAGGCGNQHRHGCTPQVKTTPEKPASGDQK
jgi:hypothetical protein